MYSIVGVEFNQLVLDVESAAWDGHMTARAQSRNVRGVVVGGRTRDLVEHRASGFPVFAQGHSSIGDLPLE